MIFRQFFFAIILISKYLLQLHINITVTYVQYSFLQSSRYRKNIINYIYF